MNATEHSVAQTAPDFVAYFGEMSTCWTIEAKTDAAKEFAKENIPVESWMGSPEKFTTDWRPARNLCYQLAAEGFVVACKQPHRPDYAYLDA